MSNPTPTLNNINAFDATQGTTISFNIIGGTDIVRSNIVYIYDLSTNDLICTHLYISTESIHELPPNTDPSIVYADGKSSADFVNNKNYYLQIQTFTNTAGTAGGSGMSVAKTFWCLFNPALSVNAIPAAISTTSYNVGATYTTNITDVTIPVTNIIQQYKFDLYTATGTLVQTSGNIIGSGEQEGTSTTYNITYNFSGLVVNNSYYVVVTTTSTEGMTVSAQSNTFTVSIDTPTVGGAIVNNNACDGYISVVSNLSDEYGGSASGEMASFETDSVNDVSSLKVTLTPQQDGTPWIGTDHDTAPYLNRAMPTQSNVYNRESGVIVGGTVAWNQLVNNGDFAESSGWSMPAGGTISNGQLVTSKAGATNEYINTNLTSAYWKTVTAGHKYLFMAYVKSDNRIGFYPTGTAAQGQVGYSNAGVYSSGKILSYIWNPSDEYRIQMQFRCYTGSGITTDLSLTLKNVVGFDLTAMFGTTIADYIYSLEQATAGAGVAWFRKYFPEDYYPYSANTLQSVQATAHKTYDADDNVLGNYALDSSLTLRGIPKLDANNNLYYDGDTYESDGTVTRKYGVVVLNGSEPSWGKSGGALNGYYVRMDSGSWQSDGYMKINAPVIALGYTYTDDVQTYFNNYGYTYTDTTIGFNIDPSICGSTLADFKAWLAQNPITVIYELATPTTETAQAYTNPQVVDPDGTEEYVTANYVPVGHDSTYSLVCPISGYDEVSANVVGKNLLDPQTIVTGKYYNNVLAEVTNAGKAHSGIIPIKPSTKYCLNGFAGQSFYAMLALDANKQPIATWYGGASKTEPFVATSPSNACYMILNFNADQIDAIAFYESETVDGYIPYNGTQYTTDLNQTVYGGTVDLATGVLTVDRKMVDLSTIGATYNTGWNCWVKSPNIADAKVVSANTIPMDAIASNMTAVMASGYTANHNAGTFAQNTSGLLFFDNGSTTELTGQLVYKLAQPQTYQLTPHQIQTLVGQNNIWSDAGNVDVTFNLPISNLLVKRQDTSDVSGNWLTLYSQPITQASDMDFTFIDFLNQNGKTYRYALVPLLTQQQGDIDVEIEGGYTVSDDVLSVFDGVFVANNNGSQKLKASTEYGDLETNQDVGVLTTIGNKYPFVVSNSNLNYHSGSISALIVPSDFYTNGDLDRLSIVERREAIEQFLTDKTAKVLKDWNGNIWLITFVDNVEVSFVDDYGMGLGTLSAKWVEIGDVNDQTDLKQTGLI